MRLLIITISTLLNVFQLKAQMPIIIGAMKNVMWKGELQGNILLDTISNKTHLYGMGPLEGLKGEIMIIDGKCYVSKYTTDSTAILKEDYKVKAPFFGYANIKKWKTISLPANIQNIELLDKYLLKKQNKDKEPFFFKIETEVENASIHIMDLPDNVKVISPQTAHDQGQKNYSIQNQKVILLGFFSTNHQTIFTHHDTYTHIHLMTTDYKMMGHLDKLKMKKGAAKIFLPIN